MKNLFLILSIAFITSCSESDSPNANTPPAEDPSSPFEYEVKLSRNARSFEIVWSGQPDPLWQSIQFCATDETKPHNCAPLKQAKLNEQALSIALTQDISLDYFLTMIDKTHFILLLNDENKIVARHEIAITQDFVNQSIQYIKAKNSTKGDKFGASAAISAKGKIVAIGAPFSNNGAGAVHIFTDGINGWEHTALLQDSNASANFGARVALNNEGSLLVVGAPGDEVTGSIVIFEKTSSEWTQVAKFLSPIADKDKKFGGFGLALSGNGEVIAAAIDSNHPYVYTYKKKDGNWQQDINIKTVYPYEVVAFGRTIAISDDGSVLAIRAEGGYEYGSVYVYRKNIDQSDYGEPVWINADTGSFDTFAISLDFSADGNVLAVGTDGRNQVHIYDFLASEAVPWRQRMILTLPADLFPLSFGGIVSLSDDGKTLTAYSSDSKSSYLGIAKEMPVDVLENVQLPAVLIFQLGDSEQNTKQLFYLQPKTPVNATYSAFNQVLLSGNAKTLVITAQDENSTLTNINPDEQKAAPISEDVGAAWFIHF